MLQNGKSSSLQPSGWSSVVVLVIAVQLVFCGVMAVAERLYQWQCAAMAHVCCKLAAAMMVMAVPVAIEVGLVVIPAGNN
jgi:hypothetical protein